MFSIKKTTLNALQNEYSIVESIVTSGQSGILDTTFGPDEDGKIITDIDNKNNFARSVEIDDTYIYVCGHTTYILPPPPPPGGINPIRRLTFVRYKKDDYTSPPDIINTPLNTGSDTVCAQLKLYNGSIYVCGYMGTYTGTNSDNRYDFIIVKYTNTNNITLDTTFGTQGILTVSSGIIVQGGTQDFFDQNSPSLAIDNTGVYFSGTSFTSTGYDFGLFKCDYNGVIDNTFGTQGTGIVTTNIIIQDVSKSLQLDENYIYVAGSTSQLSGILTFTVVRYNKLTGEIDMTFGQPILPVPPTVTVISGILANISSTSSYFLRSMKIDNTHIYLTGTSVPGETLETVLIKYNKQNGILDTTFGSTGTGIVLDNSYLSTSIDSDNDYLYVCGTNITTETSINNVLLVRYRKNGVIDNTFGTQGTGIVVTDSDFNGIGESVKLHNSYIYLAATRNSFSQTQVNDGATGNNTDFALYRYTNSTSETKTIENKLVAIKFKSL